MGARLMPRDDFAVGAALGLAAALVAVSKLKHKHKAIPKMLSLRLKIFPCIT